MVDAVLIVGGFLLLTLLLGWAVARLAPADVRREHNDLAGFILAVIGVVYAVLLAFVVIGVWERFQAAEERSYAEAGALQMVYRDAGSFAGGEPVRAALRDYVNDVIVDEWPKMQSGGQSERADRELEVVDREVRDLDVVTKAQQDVHAQMLGGMQTALDDRDLRLSESATGINGIMWVVLVLGAIVTVSFTYLFGFRETLMQRLMIGSLGLVIGLVLYLAVALDYPYRGSVTVGPEAFGVARESFEVIGR